MRSSARNALQEVLQGLPASLWRLQATKELFSVRSAGLTLRSASSSTACLRQHPGSPPARKGLFSGQLWGRSPLSQAPFACRMPRSWMGQGSMSPSSQSDGCQQLSEERSAAAGAHLGSRHSPFLLLIPPTVKEHSLLS